MRTSTTRFRVATDTHLADHPHGLRRYFFFVQRLNGENVQHKNFLYWYSSDPCSICSPRPPKKPSQFVPLVFATAQATATQSDTLPTSIERPRIGSLMGNKYPTTIHIKTHTRNSSSAPPTTRQCSCGEVHSGDATSQSRSIRASLERVRTPRCPASRLEVTSVHLAAKEAASAAERKLAQKSSDEQDARDFFGANGDVYDTSYSFSTEQHIVGWVMGVHHKKEGEDHVYK